MLGRGRLGLPVADNSREGEAGCWCHCRWTTAARSASRRWLPAAADDGRKGEARWLNLPMVSGAVDGRKGKAVWLGLPHWRTEAEGRVRSKPQNGSRPLG